jgi:hypothetical protein
MGIKMPKGMPGCTVHVHMIILMLMLLGLSYGFSVFLKKCKTFFWNKSMPSMLRCVHGNTLKRRTA